MRIDRCLPVILALFYLPFTGASQPAASLFGQTGVSRVLAIFRSAYLRDIQYDLHFRIPSGKEEPVQGYETISFRLDHIPYDDSLLLDFKGGADRVSGLTVNDNGVREEYQNEHLRLARRWLRIGTNTIGVRFTAGNAALNRNGDFLYTLLVPDRARTLFPCFDQPDLKAIFSLSLVIPAGWKAIGNGLLLDSVSAGDSLVLHFSPSGKISTYLFSFAAGRFAESDRVADGRAMRFLYRETDSSKLRLSLDSIFRIEGQALEFMKQYTGIDYPFQKFDFVAIPDFQFGGMEHAGAIQYQSRTLFLDSGATREQFIARSNLLSHETAHMWFGDLVTMKWFNDVWMKEVFANYMANKISSITLPDQNYDLKFLTAHYPSAYSVDRTAGAHPIRQRLDNLQEAGSLYGPIIYDKAPIVMRQLESLIGPKAFQSGLRDYLHKYAGGNADWDDLIFSIQPYTKVKLYEWSQVWVNGAGRPQFSYRLHEAGGKITDLVIRQQGEDGKERVWPQLFEIALVYPGRVEELTVNMNSASVHLAAAVGKAAPQAVVFNSSGLGYGIFPVDPHGLEWVSRKSVTRAATYINLYENMLDGRVLTPRELLDYDRRALFRESEELNLNILLEQVNAIFWHFLSPPGRDSLAEGLEGDCWKAMAAAGAGNEKKLLFRTLVNIVRSNQGQDSLFAIWKKRQPPPGVRLSEDDYTGLAVALAIRNYPGYQLILAEQLSRIQNRDRKDRLEYLLPSLSNDPAERDSFFATLQVADARRKESWVLEALSYLHHPLRAAASEKYLPASLDWLEDIQRTGDVFFPQRWLQVSLGSYQTATAAAVVRSFLKQHQDYNPKLRAKILQAADNLFRAGKLISGGPDF
jgi:aminopeptidase N